MLAEYREHPDDLYLLRVGYGGIMGTLTDIDLEGFASAAFHSFPDMLKDDPITGDFGPNFFGHAWNTATYVVNDPELGWQAFGGNLTASKTAVKITPLDSYRARVYLATQGLWLTLDGGEFDAVELDSKTGVVRVGLAAATQFTSAAHLRIEQPSKINGVEIYHPTQTFQSERGTYVIPLEKKATWVELKP